MTASLATRRSLLIGLATAALVIPQPPRAAAQVLVDVVARGQAIQAARNSAVSIREFGAQQGGLSDNYEAFAKAFLAGVDIFVPPGRYLVVARAQSLDMTAKQKVFGPGTLVVQASGGQTVFKMASECAVQGVTFEGNSGFSGRILSTISNTTRGTVTGNYFDTAGLSTTCIYLEATANNWLISNNRCRIAGSLVLGIGTNNCAFATNVVDQAERPLQIYGGSFNLFVGNKLGARVTGILTLSTRSQGISNLSRGNEYLGNQIIGTSTMEEGLAFDCNGNSAVNRPENATVPIATVASASNGATLTTVSITNTGAQDFANGYWAVVLTGAAMGHIAEIEASTSSSISWSRSSGNVQALLQAGDQILITTGFIQNLVLNNVIRGGTTGVSFWGSAWYNRAEGNQCMGGTKGVRFASVIQLNDPTLAGVQSYSGFNTAGRNTVTTRTTGDETTTDAGVRFHTQTYGSGSAYVARRNPGSRALDNEVLGAGITFQDCYKPQAQRNRVGPASTLLAQSTTGLVEAENYVGETLTAFTQL